MIDMGVNLTPIIIKKVRRLEDFKGRSLAVDANNYLYQFLSLIRKPDGTPLQDSHSNITSHLAGLLYRSTKLIHDYDLDLVFVFDGQPPLLKTAEILRRRELRRKASQEWHRALNRGDYATAFSKAVMTSRLTPSMIQDAKTVLELLGIPFIQASGEAEAQCAYLTSNGEVWAASSKDYDTLLFGATRLLRYLTLTGRQYLPSKGVSRPLQPELIELEHLLTYWNITREALIDLAILIGTDFNQGVRGIGPKRGLSLIQKYGNIENIPQKIKWQIEEQNYEELRKLFLQPNIVTDYSLKYTVLQADAVYDFLCIQRAFSRRRVRMAIQRMKNFYERKTQTELHKWFS